MYRFNKAALAVCAASGVIAGVLYHHQAHLSEVGVHTIGHVIRIDIADDSEAGATYTPVVQYDVDRASYAVRSSGTGFDRHAVGEPVTVLYDPSSPGDATIDSYEDRWFAFTIFSLVCAGGFIVTGVSIKPPLPKRAPLPRARVLS